MCCEEGSSYNSFKILCDFQLKTFAYKPTQYDWYDLLRDKKNWGKINEIDW